MWHLRGRPRGQFFRMDGIASLVETERAVKAVRAAMSIAAAGGKEFRYWLDLPVSACNCHRVAMNARLLEHFE
jgi:hypothetical protein